MNHRIKSRSESATRDTTPKKLVSLFLRGTPLMTKHSSWTRSAIDLLLALRPVQARKTLFIVQLLVAVVFCLAQFARTARRKKAPREPATTLETALTKRRRSSPRAPRSFSHRILGTINRPQRELAEIHRPRGQINQHKHLACIILLASHNGVQSLCWSPHDGAHVKRGRRRPTRVLPPPMITYKLHTNSQRGQKCQRTEPELSECHTKRQRRTTPERGRGLR